MCTQPCSFPLSRVDQRKWDPTYRNRSVPVRLVPRHQSWTWRDERYFNISRHPGTNNRWALGTSMGAWRLTLLEHYGELKSAVSRSRVPSSTAVDNTKDAMELCSLLLMKYCVHLKHSFIYSVSRAFNVWRCLLHSICIHCASHLARLFLDFIIINNHR